MEIQNTEVFAGLCENEAEPFDPCYHQINGPIELDAAWLEQQLKEKYTTDRVQIWCIEFSRNVMVALGSELPEWQQDLILQDVDHAYGPNGTHFWLEREDDGQDPTVQPPSDPSVDTPVRPVPIAV